MIFKKLKLLRANQTSPFGQEHRAQAIAVDEHGCLLFLVCHQSKSKDWTSPKFAKVDNPERYVYESLK